MRVVHAGHYFCDQTKRNLVVRVLSPFVSLDKLKIWTLCKIDWAFSQIPQHLVEHCVILKGATITCHLNSDSDVRSECINFWVGVMHAMRYWCRTPIPSVHQGARRSHYKISQTITLCNSSQGLRLDFPIGLQWIEISSIDKNSVK